MVMKLEIPTIVLIVVVLVVGLLMDSKRPRLTMKQADRAIFDGK